MKEYNDVVRSIRRDKAKANFERNGRAPKPARPKKEKRQEYGNCVGPERDNRDMQTTRDNEKGR